ncbi:CHASE2 domain-containing protein, partial [Roseiarcus sp.]|uniref:CHASE2 domain-containing protein n=1 Tax=Roseiarcus sp. TaxID=1969460 RepID=UPI003F9942CF
MPRPGRRTFTAVALAFIAIASATLAAPPGFSLLRGFSLDAATALRWRMFGDAHETASSPTAVIALDEETYRTPPFKGTPTIAWTGEIGRVLAAVLNGGAKVVGFDVIFPTTIEDSDITFDKETIGERMRGFDRDFLRALAAGASEGRVVLGAIRTGDDVILPAAGQRVVVGQTRNIRFLNVYT